MPRRTPRERDSALPLLKRFPGLRRLAADRSGHSSVEHVRHQLYVERDKRGSGGRLIKLASKPGTVYQHNLANEIATLSTIKSELSDSPYFPVIHEHGHLGDGRLYVITSMFDEFPLAASIGAERAPARMVAHLRAAIEVARAIGELHRLDIVHVDLNPMNILYRTERGTPIVRIVDFESSYERARHSAGVFYDPPTTPGYSAPEVLRQAPDARSDVFSLGAVLYTMLAGFRWTWEADVSTCVEADHDIDPEMKETLRPAVDPDLNRRYPSMQAFHDALAGYLERIWPGRSW